MSVPRPSLTWDSRAPRRASSSASKPDQPRPAARGPRLQERLAEVRRARAGGAGPLILHEDDDEQAVQEYVAHRERMGAELVVVVRSLAPRPAGQKAPWG